MNVVAIGAHPDDIELGVGGSVALHQQQGDNVRFLLLTKGGELSEQSTREHEAKGLQRFSMSTTFTFSGLRIRECRTTMKSFGK